MSSFTTGLSALNTSQRALDVVANNIANSGTPGYHRQVARLATRLPMQLEGLSIGAGVQVTDIRRMRSSLLEAAVTQQGSELSDTTAQLTALRHIESFLTGGEGSIHERLESFFNQLEQLSARPDDSTLRQGVLGTAVALADQFGSLAGEFSKVRAGLDLEIDGVVREIGPLAQQIAALNGSIQRLEVRGIDANDLRDQRDQLVNEIAERAGIRVIEQDNGQTTVLLGGVALVVGNEASDITTGVDDEGHAIVTVAGSDEPTAITGGSLGGLLQVRNQSLPGFEDRLNAIAQELITRLDALHATGIGLGGPQTSVSGQRSATSVTAPLASAGLDLPPQAGTLSISVTNLATGQRTLDSIAIDPQSQSLADIAAAISSVGNVQAIADTQTKTLNIFAAAGYAFDFAGRVQPSPAVTGITGSTVPTMGGTYTGAANDAFTFRVIGSGTVGVTPNLSLEVRNSAGSVVASLNIGEGYEPGSAILAANGITVRMAAGTANSNDTFSAQVVANADTAGILTALGLNTFFTGHDANDIRVRDEIIANPALLAASATGQAGDGAILRRMAAVRDLPLLGDSTQTLTQAYAAMVGDVGQQVQVLDQRETNQSSLGQNLAAQQQSISGVDPNEELVKMVELQRMFQLASRYINAVNETLSDLFRII